MTNVARWLAAAAVLTCLLPAAASAQHCWPTSFALVVRGPNGAVIDPRPLLDSLRSSPASTREVDFRTEVINLDPGDTNADRGASGMPAIVWYGQGACRVDVREVVLRRGGVVMRLWMDVHLDSQRRPGPSDYLLKTPPLEDGTWRLDVCVLPTPRVNTRAAIPSRWVRVSASGEPGTPWQAPQGCGAAG
jgi:hypothetical protein